VLAPFATYIYVPEDKFQVVKVVGYFGYVSLFAGVVVAHSMNLMLMYIFCSQFKKLKKNFSRAFGERRQFNGDVSMFRRRHQTLSRAVSKADGFMRLSNVAGFVCHIINTILLFYSIIFYPESTKNFYFTASFVFLLVANIDGLAFAAGGGIIVNHVVCIIMHLLFCICLRFNSDLTHA